MRSRFLFLLPLAFLPSSNPVSDEGTGQDFTGYWHQGKAELSRFALEQSRYGEVRKGDAILVFVTEDFLPEKQVKHEGSDPGKAGAVPILKLNFLKKFNTGIYDYSMMQSVFTPTDLQQFPHSLKTSVSIQEWCGHVWMQLNLRGGKYEVLSHSYFEREADQAFELERVWLEDEIWNRIRLSPETLPLGSIRMIPSLFDSRLRHRKPRVEEAEASFGKAPGKERVYRIAYPGRSLEIRFRAAFPHDILGFQEVVTRPSGGKDVTRAERTHMRLSAYWSENGNAHEPFRRELGLK